MKLVTVWKTIKLGGHHINKGLQVLSDACDSLETKAFGAELDSILDSALENITLKAQKTTKTE